MDEMEVLLRRGLGDLGLPETAAPAMARYGALLLETNQVMNLTAITDPADVAALHFLDSAALLTLTDFKEGRDSNPLLDSLDPEVLRDRFRIHVDDIEQLGQTVEAVEQVKGVANTSVALEIAQGFVLVRNIATGVALVLIGILVVVSLFIIANTIKLATFYRREEIAIMKMCGATNAFVQWPFVVEGLLLGLTGALVAFFVQWGIYQMVAQFIVKGNGLSLVTMISYPGMAKIILPVFCGTGALIGVGGSLLAIRKFLQV